MNKAEIKAIWEEMTFLSKDVFFDLLTYAFQKPFDYLVLDRDNNEYYRKFNKIEIYNKEDHYAEKKQYRKRNIIANRFKKNKGTRCLNHTHRPCMCIYTKTHIRRKHSRTCIKRILGHRYLQPFLS